MALVREADPEGHLGEGTGGIGKLAHGGAQANGAQVFEHRKAVLPPEAARQIDGMHPSLSGELSNPKRGGEVIVRSTTLIPNVSCECAGITVLGA